MADLLKIPFLVLHTRQIGHLIVGTKKQTTEPSICYQFHTEKLLKFILNVVKSI